MTVPAIQPGSLIGRYRVERVLGEGGMGIVYLAEHIEIPQRAAIKVLHRELLAVPEAIERFLREAQAAVKLRGENVGTVMDAGRMADGVPYMVMELLVGEDLASHLQKYHPLPIAEVIDYAIQACAGLAEAHAKGIVHRDVKPPNLFRTARPDGTPLIKVLDFGIAKVREGDHKHVLTRTNVTMGSIPYMAPEQLRSSKAVDTRADVWSLGATIYHLLSGEYPFPFTSLGDAAVRIWTEEPAPLAGRVPPELCAVIASCFVKDPVARMPDVATLAGALAPFGGPSARAKAERVARILHPRAESPIPIASTPRLAAAEATSTLSGSSGATSGEQRKRPLRWIAFAVASIAAMVAIIVIATRSPETPIPNPVPTVASGAAKVAKQLAELPENPWVAVTPASSRVVLGLDANRIAAGAAGFDAAAKEPRSEILAPTVAFQILSHEVTIEELGTWLGERDEPAWPGEAMIPATRVPWSIASAFCRERLGGDLPTEAQWEWSALPLASKDLLDFFAFKQLDPRIPGSRQADRVEHDGKAIHDLGGNAREWTRSPWFDDRARVARHGRGEYRTIRGLPLARSEDATRQDPAIANSTAAHYREPGCSAGPCLTDTTANAALEDVGFRCVR